MMMMVLLKEVLLDFRRASELGWEGVVMVWWIGFYATHARGCFWTHDGTCLLSLFGEKGLYDYLLVNHFALSHMLNALCCACDFVIAMRCECEYKESQRERESEFKQEAGLLSTGAGPFCGCLILKRTRSRKHVFWGLFTVWCLNSIVQ